MRSHVARTRSKISARALGLQYPARVPYLSGLLWHTDGHLDIWSTAADMSHTTEQKTKKRKHTAAAAEASAGASEPSTKRSKTDKVKKDKSKSKSKGKEVEAGQFKVTQASLLLSIPPVFANNLRTGAEEMLDSMLMRCANFALTYVRTQE